VEPVKVSTPAPTTASRLSRTTLGLWFIGYFQGAPDGACQASCWLALTRRRTQCADRSS
jgi:hypothetical protein